MKQVHSVIEQDFEAVNRLIVERLDSSVEMVENIGQYIVEGGGKRLRPLVSLLCARGLGYQEMQHIKLATVIEFLHTATLLHDDVVDVSELRRGRATANSQWGMRQAYWWEISSTLGHFRCWSQSATCQS